MQKVNLFQKIKKRWVKNELSFRIREIAIQSLSYLILTCIIMGAIGAIIQSFFDPVVSAFGIIFVALFYFLKLGVVIARLFDKNTISYRLDKILENTDPSVVDRFITDLDEFEKRNGLS